MEVKMLGAFQRIKETEGKIFSVQFVKKNGDIRDMVCRLGVTKGVTGVGMSYNPADHNLVTVFDMQKGEFRMINMETIIKMKLNGEVIYVKG